MKFISIVSLFIFTICISPFLFADISVNGRFVVINQDSLHYTVKFQINADINNDTLGCSTIIFNYDSSSIAFPASPIENTDYKFLNFHGTYYSSTITRPLQNQLWVNIVSLFPDKGTAAAQSPAWTDVVELTFKVLKKDGTSNMVWQPSNNNWAVYDIDNATILNSGNWANENTSLSGDAATGFTQNSQTPKEFHLFQNYPNPFNPSTVISYTVAPLNLPKGETLVTIKVYDILGREVATLVNEEKSAGTYSVKFNAGNLSSGTYLYRIVSGNYTQVKKMLLLK